MSYTIRPIQPQDNPQMAQVIRDVSAEFGLTADKGYSVADPTLDSLFEVYQVTRAHYWVMVDKDGLVVRELPHSPVNRKCVNYRRCIF